MLNHAWPQARSLPDAVVMYLTLSIQLFCATRVAYMTALLISTEQKQRAVMRFLWAEGVRSSTPLSQKPGSGTYSEPQESNWNLLSSYYKIYFNIISKSLLVSPKWSHSFTVSNPNMISIFLHSPNEAFHPSLTRYFQLVSLLSWQCFGSRINIHISVLFFSFRCLHNLATYDSELMWKLWNLRRWEMHIQFWSKTVSGRDTRKT